jgi:hypothetical protein
LSPIAAREGQRTILVGLVFHVLVAAVAGV